MAPSLILLDVCLLTVLLFCSGGSSNPFSIFYVVHLVMAVVVLGPTWTWVIVAIACLSYALLFQFHIPLVRTGELPAPTLMAGQWAAFALASVSISYFVGRVASALRARERELLAVRDRVAQAEQIASLTTLAAGAAHELGTPLGTIAIVAKELEFAASLAGGTSESVIEDARLIRQEVDRCRKILDRMRLDIVENLHQKIGELSLDGLLEVLREDLSEDERRRLHVVSPVSLKTVRGPIRAIEQAIGVLLRNAFDAAPVTEKVNLVIEKPQGRTIFCVEDFGQGMTEDVLRRAGQPFFTTKQPGKGMGLGLFLVKLVAKRYGGGFEIESTPGQGTRCEFFIPDRFAGSLDETIYGTVINGGNASVI
jgi:two-component system sensor histidine kinase RegB